MKVAPKVVLPAMYFCSLLPSVDVVYRVLGPWPTIGWFVAGAALLWAVERLIRWMWPTRVDSWTPLLVAAATLGLALVFVLVLYPRLNVHLPGHGSDRDDALNEASRALLRRQFPYGTRTYLHNLISPLPGALILNIPALAFGGIAYMNIAWLALFLIMNYALCSDRRAPLFAFWALLASPAALAELATGGDLLSNGVYVAAALSFFLWSFDRGHGSSVRAVAGLLLGVTLASRVGLTSLFLLAGVFAHRRVGWSRTLAVGAVAIFTFSSLTLPFFFYAPERFSPLHVYHQYDAVMPRSGLAMTIASLAVTIGLCRSALLDTVGGTLAAAVMIVGAPIALLAGYALVTRYPAMMFVIAERAILALPLALTVIASKHFTVDHIDEPAIVR